MWTENEVCDLKGKKIKGRGGFYFSLHIETLANDTHDSSTIKATHFKEDEAGDLKELPDMKRNSDSLLDHHPPPFSLAGETERGEEAVQQVCLRRLSSGFHKIM